MFEGTHLFENNQDSAIFLTSTKINFAANSRASFINNYAFEGAAMFLLGFSMIVINDDSDFLFEGNSATNAGGAIFQHSFDQRNFFGSQSCFIRYSGKKNVTERNITFTFSNNVAGQYGGNSSNLGWYGHTIHAITIIPCYSSCKGMVEDVKNVFSCYATFVFQNEREYEISTNSNDTIIQENKLGKNMTLYVVPGKLFELHIETRDDFSKNITTVYYVSIIKSNDSSLRLDDAFKYLSNKMIRFYGKPGDEGIVQLETIGPRAQQFRVKVQIQQCPPGYTFNRSPKKMKCECFTFTKHTFSGIQMCDDEKFQAQLTPGYWVGYNTTALRGIEFGSEKYFVYGVCPQGQCLNETLKRQVPRSLPQDTSIKALDAVVCGKTRTSVLCSVCRDGYVAHYHDDTYACKEDNCHLGWLFYIITEILPVTAFFIAVMVFDIKTFY